MQAFAIGTTGRSPLRKMAGVFALGTTNLNCDDLVGFLWEAGRTCIIDTMKVSEIGEFGLIALVAKTIGDFKLSDLSPHASSPPLALPSSPRVLLDIGDDTTAWRAEFPIQLATTDTLVQNVHFTLMSATWRELGWKSLAVNISDIAAMGGIPRCALITLGLPGEMEVDPIVDLYKGMMDIALRFGVVVAGGDMVASRDVFITAALTGEAQPEPGARVDYLMRSAARPGDKIAVTGYLGSSAAGLKMLLEGVALAAEAAAYLRDAHLRPVPRIAEGMLIRRAGGMVAMDISDGLLADLTKVCKASNVGGTVFVEELPIHSSVRSAFSEDAVALALSGGEDYELLFTAPENVVERVREEARIPVTVIGEVTREDTGRVRVVDGRGREVQPRRFGWDHYRRG